MKRWGWIGGVSLALLVALSIGAEVVAQTGFRWPVAGVLTPGAVIYARDRNNFGSSTALSLGTASVTAATFGASGTAVTQVRIYDASLNPVAITADNTTATQNFTVTGVSGADNLYLGGGVAPTALCAPVLLRAISPNTVAITFLIFGTATCTPATGTYEIVAIRS